MYSSLLYVSAFTLRNLPKRKLPAPQSLCFGSIISECSPTSWRDVLPRDVCVLLYLQLIDDSLGSGYPWCGPTVRAAVDSSQWWTWISATFLYYQVLQEYKFEFIKIVCSHEHYVQLSLPTLKPGYAKGKGQLVILLCLLPRATGCQFYLLVS